MSPVRILFEGIVDSIFVVDIELNGYQDIVLVSSSANEVVWLNNTDGTGGSFDNHTIAQPSGTHFSLGLSLLSTGYLC